MTVREARAIAKKYPTALVFELLKPWFTHDANGPRAGQIVTLAGKSSGSAIGVELVAPGIGQCRDCWGSDPWWMHAVNLRPLNAASRRALAQVSR